MNNVRSITLALQFPLSKGFKPRIVVEDLISIFKLFLLQLFIIPPFNPFFVYLHFHMLSTSSPLARLFGFFTLPPRHQDRGLSL
jgi:hypothetical protein